MIHMDTMANRIGSQIMEMEIPVTIVSMWIISRYPLGDREIDKINREIQARR